jgi:hypothetical protein
MTEWVNWHWFASVWGQLDLQDSQYLWNILKIKSKEVQDFLQLLLDQPGNQKNDRYVCDIFLFG